MDADNLDIDLKEIINDILEQNKNLTLNNAMLRTAVKQLQDQNRILIQANKQIERETAVLLEKSRNTNVVESE
jgi:regulator of replication initiation timing